MLQKTSILFNVFESIYKEILNVPSSDELFHSICKEIKQVPIYQSSLYKVIPKEIMTTYTQQLIQDEKANIHGHPNDVVYRHFHLTFPIGKRTVVLYISRRDEEGLCPDASRRFAEERSSGVKRSIEIHQRKDTSETRTKFRSQTNIGCMWKEHTGESLSDIFNLVYHCIWFLNHVEEISHSNVDCSKTIRIYLLFTPDKKCLPDSKGEPLQYLHCNTGATYSCARYNDIVIFREEEWFKVLIHECIHALGLDYASGDDKDISSAIHSLYRGVDVRSKSLAIYEAYTETWAQMLYHIFHLAVVRKDKTKIRATLLKDVYKQWITKWNQECWWACFQCSKILFHYGIRYKDLVNHESKHVKKYYEQYTNVFSYYLLRPLLMTNVEEFLLTNIRQKIFLTSVKSQHNTGTSLSTSLFTNQGKTKIKMPLYTMIVAPNPYEPYPFISFIQAHYNQESWIQLIDDTFSQDKVSMIPIEFRKSLRMSFPNHMKTIRFQLPNTSLGL